MKLAFRNCVTRFFFPPKRFRILLPSFSELRRLAVLDEILAKVTSYYLSWTFPILVGVRVRARAYLPILQTMYF